MLFSIVVRALLAQLLRNKWHNLERIIRYLIKKFRFNFSSRYSQFCKCGILCCFHTSKIQYIFLITIYISNYFVCFFMYFTLQRSLFVQTPFERSLKSSQNHLLRTNIFRGKCTLFGAFVHISLLLFVQI
jgi:hypothetical protein